MSLISFKKLFWLFLFLSLFLYSTSAIAQITKQTQIQIEALAYRPLNSSDNLMIATDSLNNTWIKGQFQKNYLYAPILFQIPNAHIPEYDLYIYNFNTLHLVPPNLDSQEEFVRGRYAQHYIITDSQTYYLNLRQYPVENLQIVATERSQFGYHEAQQLLFIGLYYGISIISMIINLVFYIVFKDKRFLTYTLLQFCIFISLFYEDGMFYYLSNSQWHMQYLLSWNIPLTSMLACLFTIYFLDIKSIFEQYKIMFISLFISSFVITIIYNIYPYELLLNITTILSFIAPIFCLIIAATQFRKNIYARFLLIAFGSIVLFGIGYTFYINSNMQEFTYFNINAFRLVSAIEIIIITFAIIYKVRDLQNLNNHYREEINTYLLMLEQKTQENKKSISTNNQTDTLSLLRIQYNLTSRETEVLTCLWQGMSNIQISERLYISLSTTKYHVSNLYNKLDIKSRNQALSLKKKTKV
ncbi:MAG: LuxR C-terminal-related transcriptional regulator [Flavobacteriaceae bacterium]|jgi:DNA-binding CsgD family transcriptional regulator|nr:LuxR C-terminal-related transcriptional regulator [Flavobacteriaceae bacterium]